MNKTILSRIPILLVGLCLAACGESNPALTEYQQNLAVFAAKDTAKVLQLTDLHFSYSEDYNAYYAYLDELIGRTLPDVVMTTGDNVLIANKESVKGFIGIMESLAAKYNFQWGTTWGNHDKQGTYNPSYFSEQCAAAEHCFYKELNDKVYGLSNYVLNLTDGASTKWQVYAIDTNILRQAGPLLYDYDIIHDDQTEWYVAQAEQAKTNNGGAYVPSLVFGHIPVWEVEYAYRLAGDKGGNDEDGTGRPGIAGTPGYVGRSSGYMKESDWEIEGLGTTRVYAGYRRTSFFEEGEVRGMRGMFFGHDHINNFVAEYKVNASSDYVAVGYGMKSNDGLTYRPEMLGGNLSEIHKDGTVAYSRVYLAKNGKYGAEANYRVEAMF